MKQRRAGNVASLMMLLWLAVHLFATFVLPKWADFLAVVACTLPMLLVKPCVRGETYGTRDCNTVIYKKREYTAFFVLVIAGSALLSAAVHIASGLDAVTAPRTDFPYLVVFACFLPAFFEEWLVRGGVLGAVAPHGGAGVWLCSVFFMLMHTDISKWPHALFAGVLITALVYVTECIYLGMLLHFLNNFTSLLLSYLQTPVSEYVALCVIAVLFMIALAVLWRSRLGKDVRALLVRVKREDVRALLSPLCVVYIVLTIVLSLYKDIL